MVHEHKRLDSIMLVHPEFAVSCGHCLFAFFSMRFHFVEMPVSSPIHFLDKTVCRCAPLRSWVGPTPTGKFHGELNMSFSLPSRQRIRGLGNGGRAEFIQMFVRLFWYGRSGQNPSSLFFLRVTLPSRIISH